MTPPPSPRRGTARRARSAASGVFLRTALAISLSSTLAISAPRPTDHPRWAVIVASDNRSWYIDEPICHSQEYFAFPGAPQRFDYDRELSGKKTEEIKDKVYSLPIGGAPGYAVRQVNHIINASELTIKMILVERKVGEFCEIYHQQMSPDMVGAEPAYLVQVGAETILATTDPISGNGGRLEELYWTFDKDGPILLDVTDKIDEILKKLLPKGLIIMNGGGFNVRTLTYGMPVWKPGDAHCCPTGGSIEIKFALKDHQLVVISRSYKEN
jgi:hypothetical protein